MESRPLAPGYELGERFEFLAMVVCFGGAGVIIAAEKLGQPLLSAAGFVGFCIGLGMFAMALALWLRADRQVDPGITGWQRIGGPSH